MSVAKKDMQTHLHPCMSGVDEAARNVAIDVCKRQAKFSAQNFNSCPFIVHYSRKLSFGDYKSIVRLAWTCEQRAHKLEDISENMSVEKANLV